MSSLMSTRQIHFVLCLTAYQEDIAERALPSHFLIKSWRNKTNVGPPPKKPSLQEEFLKEIEEQLAECMLSSISTIAMSRLAGYFDAFSLKGSAADDEPARIAATKRLRREKWYADGKASCEERVLKQMESHPGISLTPRKRSGRPLIHFTYFSDPNAKEVLIWRWEVWMDGFYESQNQPVSVSAALALVADPQVQRYGSVSFHPSGTDATVYRIL